MSLFTLVETETLIIPSPDAGGFPFIEEQDEIAFTINNIHLPDDASPGENYTLNVTVDPSDLAFGDIVHEVSDNGGQQTSTNNFVISTAAADAAQLTVDPDSFEGDADPFADWIQFVLHFQSETMVDHQSSLEKISLCRYYFPKI